MNRDEIKSRARLSDSAVDKLSRIESVLSLMADLAGADLFIDCMQEPDGRMFVGAYAFGIQEPCSRLLCKAGG